MSTGRPRTPPGSHPTLGSCGVPQAADLALVCPSAERLARGRVAILECFQQIPCDPCTKACPFGAILPMADINDCPQLDVERCVGCAVCLAGCPGLAIFMVDETFSAEESLVVIPYEMVPVPAFGESVTGLDREGAAVCAARVVAVQNATFQDRTYLVWLAVPKGMGMIVRHLQLRRPAAHPQTAALPVEGDADDR